MKVMIFSADWCNSCIKLASQINLGEINFGPKNRFAFFDIDRERKTAEEYDVRSTPQIILLDNNNKEIARLKKDFTPDNIKKFINKNKPRRTKKPTTTTKTKTNKRS